MKSCPRCLLLLLSLYSLIRLTLYQKGGSTIHSILLRRGVVVPLTFLPFAFLRTFYTSQGKERV